VANLPYPATMSRSSDLRAPEFAQDSFALPRGDRVLRSVRGRHFRRDAEFPARPAAAENAGDLNLGPRRNFRSRSKINPRLVAVFRKGRSVENREIREQKKCKKTEQKIFLPRVRSFARECKGQGHPLPPGGGSAFVACIVDPPYSSFTSGKRRRLRQRRTTLRQFAGAANSFRASISTVPGHRASSFGVAQ
jgi:hypothetical protein